MAKVKGRSRGLSENVSAGWSAFLPFVLGPKFACAYEVSPVVVGAFGLKGRRRVASRVARCFVAAREGRARCLVL